MSSLYSTIFSVFGYIILGFILKKINIIPDYITKKFNLICFNILLPIALISNFWRIKFPEIILFELLLVFFGSGIIIFIIGFFFSKKIFNFKTDDSALFGLGSCFGNSVAFGIPLMYSVLGPTDSMPYMVLVLFHGLIHFTYTTLIYPFKSPYELSPSDDVSEELSTLLLLWANNIRCCLTNLGSLN